MEHELVKLILALPWPTHVAAALALFGYGCAIAAAILPPPKPDAHVAWKVARKVVDAFAFNFNHAKNAGLPKPPVTAGEILAKKAKKSAILEERL